MELKEAVRTPELSIADTLIDKAQREAKVLVLYPTLKFSCLIAKRFKAELREEHPEEGLHIRHRGIDVYVVFRATGSKFCGGDKGFEEVDFPIKEPERFFPKWIRVNSDLSGEFGYL